MNIFFLDEDPKICAEMHCDKHVVKMVIEYAQLLSTAHRLIDGMQYEDRTARGARIKRWRHPDTVFENTLYKASHIGHPSQKWCMENTANYKWLAELWIHLCHEYTHRYGRKHLTQEKLDGILQQLPKNLTPGVWYQPPPAMSAYPQCIVEGNSLQSYHNYYIVDKARFAKWTDRDIPSWYTDLLNKHMRGNNANI